MATNDAIDIFSFDKESSYKQILEDRLKNLLFPEPYFKLHLAEYANNIRSVVANWYDDERDNYTRYLRVWKKEIRDDKWQKSMAEVKASREQKLLRYVKECYTTASNRFCDMHIVVENTLFEVHRLIVMCFIPFIFYQLSKRRKNEAQRRDIIKIRLQGVKPEAMKHIMNYIYTGDMNPTECNFLLVLETANRCFMDEFSDAWIVAFESKMQSKVLQLLFRCRVAHYFGWKDYISTLNSALALHFETLLLTEEFLHLNAHELLDILKENEIGVQNEVVIFLAVIKWLNYDWSKRKKYTFPLMKMLCFEEMTSEELMACLKPPILKEALEVPEVKAMIIDALNYKRRTKKQITPPIEYRRRIYRCKKPDSLTLWTSEYLPPLNSKETTGEKRENYATSMPKSSKTTQRVTYSSPLKVKDSEYYLKSLSAAHKNDGRRILMSKCKCHHNHRNTNECLNAAAAKIQSYFRGYRTRKCGKRHETVQSTPKKSIKSRSEFEKNNQILYVKPSPSNKKAYFRPNCIPC